MRERDGYTITGDPRRIDVDAVHAYLSRSYWAESIPREIVERSIAGSVCLALLHEDCQVGFARAVTDKATFAYLADVYVLEEHRGRGLAKWLVEELRALPELQGLRRWVLVTRDAQGLYEKLGFRPLAHADRYMEAVRVDPYR